MVGCFWRLRIFWRSSSPKTWPETDSFQVDGHHYRCPCWHLVSSASFVFPDLDHATWVTFFGFDFFRFFRDFKRHPKSKKQKIVADAGNVFLSFEALLDLYCQISIFDWYIDSLELTACPWKYGWLRDFGLPGGAWPVFSGMSCYCSFREGNLYNQIKKVWWWSLAPDLPGWDSVILCKNTGPLRRISRHVLFIFYSPAISSPRFFPCHLYFRIVSPLLMHCFCFVFSLVGFLFLPFHA